MIVSIVFAEGCFWGVEKHFEHMKGVIDAIFNTTLLSKKLGIIEILYMKENFLKY